MYKFVLLFISYAMLGAHFLRFGAMVPAIILALLPCLFFFKKKFLINGLQLGLIAGCAFVWLPTLLNIAQMRMAMGEPWVRMACILIGVIVFNLYTAWSIHKLHSKNKQLV